MLIKLGDLQPSDLDEAGNKAWNLGRMIRAGLPVPRGYCLPFSYYREHLLSFDGTHGASGPLASLLATPPPLVSDRLRWLRQHLVSSPLSPETARALEEAFQDLTHHGAPGKMLAVRSSATREDGERLSFAGQHDTILGVTSLEDCLLAVKRCWASLWTDRAFEYRRKHALPHRETGMAVILQELVPAESAGVVFTADPVTGSGFRMVMESCRGLGELLVSGKLSPERLVLARPGLEILSRESGSQTVALVALPGGGLAEQPLPPSPPAPCLEDPEARRLAVLALRAEAALGGPIDLEWARQAGAFTLLQARPITARPSAVDLQIWTNANAGEVLPDVITPLTWSLVDPLVRRLFSIFNRMGLDLTGLPLLSLVAGRVYFNLNTLLTVARLLPGMREKGLTEFFGGHQDVAAAMEKLSGLPGTLPPARIAWFRALCHLPWLLYRYLTLTASRAATAVAELRRRACNDLAFLGRERTEEELLSRLLAAISRLSDSDDFFLTAFLGQSYSSLLYGRSRQWFGEEGNALAGPLLAGLGDNANARAGLELWRLARLARRHPAVKTALQESGSAVCLRLRLSGTSEGEAWLAAWDAFLREHGHHSRGELELFNPRWEETPDDLLRQVGSFLPGAGDPTGDPAGSDDFLSRFSRLSAGREEALRSMLARLSLLRRLQCRFLARRARQFAALRENIKSEIVRQLYALRRILLALGALWAKRGLLSRADDIFFLRFPELSDIARAPRPEEAVSRLIAARRAEYQALLALSPPPVIEGKFDPSLSSPLPGPSAGQLLKGIPVYPGIVTGPARVILRSGDDQVLPGEILVAPFTDPGWTPYFLNAAALVIDLGGLLSHGSIVAREYGIPTVVNVGPATKLIRTGQRIQVDGTRGLVRLAPDG